MLLPFYLFMAAELHGDSPAKPYRQPQLAAGHGQVVMTFGGGSTIYFASSADGGQNFGAPVKVAEVGALALRRHRGPRIAVLKDALVISAIVGDKPESEPRPANWPAATELVVFRSTDRGKTWTRSGVINDVPGATREGLHAMVADASGNLHAAWLDLREKGTRLYGAHSTDGGLTWSRNYLIYESPDGTICQCCAPSLAVGPDGSVWAMWRNVLDGSRDMYASRSRDGIHFEPAMKLGQETWKLNACPMDGGGIAITEKGPFSAWRRGENPVFVRPDGRETVYREGKDVAMAVGKPRTYVAWTSKTGAVEYITPTAKPVFTLAESGGFVTLLALPEGGVLAAWETKDSIDTRLLQ